MKLFVVPILILLVATQAFSKWVLLLEFRWNQDYIAKNLCENRAKPMLKCGGRCQLAKRLAAAEKESTPLQSSPGKSNFQEVLFLCTEGCEVMVPVIKGSSSPFANLHHWKIFSPPCAVFRPPLV